MCGPKPYGQKSASVRLPTQPLQLPANSTAPGMLPAPGFGVVGEKSVQRLLRPVGGRLPSQRTPEVHDQLRSDAPVVLEVAAEIVELLADETDGIDLSAIGISEQERGERIAARIADWMPPGTPVS